MIDPEQFDLNNGTVTTKVNSMIAVLNQITDSIADGGSGADAISLTTISGFTSVKLQAFLEEVLTRLQSTTDTVSGADFIGSTGITGVTGTTVQAQLESLKAILDANKTAIETRMTSVEGRATSLEGRATSLEGRATTLESGKADKSTTYTKTEVDNKTFVTTNIADLAVTTAKLANQAVTADKISPTLLDTVVLNTHRLASVIDHPDGSVTYAKLNSDVTSRLGFGTTTNVGNDYSIILSPVPVSYTDGMTIKVKINVDSTGASTLNVNSLGAKALKSANGNDASGLKSNGIYTFIYNATTGNFILQGEGVDVTPLITAQNAIFDM